MRAYIANPWDDIYWYNLYTDLFMDYKNWKLQNKGEVIKKIENKKYKSLIYRPADFRKRGVAVEKLFCNCLMQGGKFLKVRAHLRKAQSLLFHALMFDVPIYFKKKYSFFETLGQIIIFDNHWLLYTNLLSYFLNKAKPMFFLKARSIKKQLKKKKKIFKLSPYSSYLSVIPLHRQLGCSVREFSLYVKSYKKKVLRDRIVGASLNLFMLDKNNFLQKKKLACYKKVFKRYINLGELL